MLSFTNRAEELAELDAHAKAGGLLVVYGRRRVGKTRLLTHWLRAKKGMYSQAIEAPQEFQLAQVFADVREGLQALLEPRTWTDFFRLVDRLPKAPLLCLDELPYLVASDPTLPSVLQRWIDHRSNPHAALIVSGSSTRMMNDVFLNRAAPLYGRARKLLAIAPMSYRAFCAACRQNPSKAESFVKFSLVGGVPKYWEAVEPGQSAVELAEALFFGASPQLEFEPQRLLKDEGIVGVTAPAVLEAIGRGAEKPSEVAGRLGTQQTNLSRLFQQLLDAHLLERQLPYGESVRSTKRTSYRIADPTIRFWYHGYSPHRTRWSRYTLAEREQLLDRHAASVFEDQLRALWPDASRYWEGDVELDLVRAEGDELVVGEIKWAALGKTDRARAEHDLEAAFGRSKLAQRHRKVRFEVLDLRALQRL